MIKSIFVGRRAPGRGRAAAMRHLLEVHGPMVVCAPADSGPLPKVYVQNHVIDGAYPEHGEQAIERDLVTEFWFDDLDAMRASGTTPYYQANMKPDEPRFVTTASVAKMRVAETVVLDGARGRYKAFLLARRAGGVDDDAWARGCVDAAQAMARAAGVTALVRNDVVFPEEEARFADVVLEAWLAEREAAVAAIDLSATLLAAFGGGADRERSLMLAAEEHDAARIRAHHEARSPGGGA